MLIIRFQRRGAKNSPEFRLVLAEKYRAASKKVLEVFGRYDPKSKDLKLIDADKLKVWVGRGVEISPSVRNLLINKQVITGTKVKAWRPKVKAKPEAKPAEKKEASPAEKQEEKPAEKPVEQPAPSEEKKSV
ncbi:MAG: 30S ribosomal protein S16 [Patescibacteria group bacterium]|nr:30S ribosomal protein S16 [Patescibacteria group bacterium]